MANPRYRYNAVTTFLETQEAFELSAKGLVHAQTAFLKTDFDLDRHSNLERQMQSTVMLGISRAARLFEVSYDDYYKLSKEIEAYLTNKLLGDPSGDRPVTLHDIAVVRKAADSIPFPEPLPFPSVAIFFDIPVILPYRQAELRIGLNHPARKKYRDGISVMTTGFLLHADPQRCTEVGWWFPEMVLNGERGLDMRSDSRGAYSMNHYGGFDQEGGGWSTPTSFIPWTINGLIATINDKRTVTVKAGSGFAERREVKRMAKQLKLKRQVPPPYYRVTVGDRFIFLPPDGLEGASSTTVNWSHRWDVRGHEHVKVRRGPLPLTISQRAWLLARKYRIYERGEMPEEDIHRICTRAHKPKQQGEWLAVKHKWVNSFVKGPEGLPHIPSTHVVKDIHEKDY